MAQLREVGAGVQRAVGEMNVVELLQEPLVNLREFVDLVDGVALQEGFFDKLGSGGEFSRRTYL